ncbi:hypothetical protein A6770_24660 [Nostoc minutum NIES-26]|uniref:Uncharacterized protein n=1 Tax=Nostoc minutum NIES-26 TaxID=1844469 RepID=A0A367QUT5_9NOSO|nr:hypothetical protein A6770_24660 [Nostoc minutum NIES-26]
MPTRWSQNNSYCGLGAGNGVLGIPCSTAVALLGEPPPWAGLPTCRRFATSRKVGSGVKPQDPSDSPVT